MAGLDDRPCLSQVVGGAEEIDNASLFQPNSPGVDGAHLFGIVGRRFISGANWPLWRL